MINHLLRSVQSSRQHASLKVYHHIQHVSIDKKINLNQSVQVQCS